ncbi:MAG: HRDC domain-containing protein [Acidothermus sp.]|nr:HRDC domain-containing protein [Acidothermus sp.]MCL6537135.1 HRDC domain-containing protein [Acidothermus sp.]
MSTQELLGKVLPHLSLRDGLPDLIDTPDQLARAAQALASGEGPVAIDAERASAYRYGHRAYLIQLRREGVGTFLVDPIRLSDLSPLAAAIGSAEWVIHAAAQDLPCLAERGLRPARLFDTELAARLAGYPRVGLAAMVETLLGFRLDKNHARVDWSRRPLPEAWLRYAALDVEVLAELREILRTELRRQGKLRWAAEEFEYLRTSLPPTPAPERWRRVSGIHQVRGRRGLAVVRELWSVRDHLAREADLSPTRLLPDEAIIWAATHRVTTREQLLAAGFPSRDLETWWTAVRRAHRLADSALPAAAPASPGPPPAHRWRDKSPAAAERLAAARAAVAALADEHRLPAENLLSPDVVRRLCWDPPDPPDEAAVAEVLRRGGARPWQIRLTAGPLSRVLVRAAVHAVDVHPVDVPRSPERRIDRRTPGGNVP